MEVVNTKFQILRCALLIAGTTIGAGMLGIPATTVTCGFLPAMLITLGVYGFMLLTGLLLLEVTLHMPDGSSVISIAERYLGRWGKVVTGGLFIFLYLCLMVAYVAAGGPILGSFLGLRESGILAPLLFCLVFGVIVFRGPKSIDRVNFSMTILMGFVWLLLVGLGVSSINPANYARVELSKAMFCIPLLFSAFGFHNMVPSLTTYMKRDKRALQLSILIGTLIPLIVYILWQWLIIGVVDSAILADAYHKGLPVTALLQAATGSSSIMIVGTLFAFLAISTSVLGVSFSLIDFLADGFKVKAEKTARLFLTLVTFGVPLALATLNPDIFERSLGIAGGFGEAMINGFIPVAFVFMARYYYNERENEIVGGGKWALGALLLFSVFAFCVEAYHLLV